MPRVEIQVIVTGKDDLPITVKVRESKIVDLEIMAEKIAPAVTAVIAADSMDDIKDAFITVLYDYIPEIFPPLTKEDIKEAYPSEIEALGEAFLELNFFSIRRIMPVLINLVQAGMRVRILQMEAQAELKMAEESAKKS